MNSKKYILLFLSFVVVQWLFGQNTFQVTPNPGCVGVPVSFATLFSSNYVPIPNFTTGYSYYWNFGNGQTSTQPNVTGFVYNSANDYHIRHVVYIDTVGFVLKKVEVLAGACNDPFGGAPDPYLIITNGNNQTVFSTASSPYNDTHFPVSWNLNILLTHPPYRFWVWDKDSYDGDDNCVNDQETQPGVYSNINLPPNDTTTFGETVYSFTNQGLTYRLYFSKNVTKHQESYTYTVHSRPSLPVLVENFTHFCLGQSPEPLVVLSQSGYEYAWFSDTTLTQPLLVNDTFYPNITQAGSYQYFVTQIDTNTQCRSGFIAASVQVIALPGPLVKGYFPILCEGEQIQAWIAFGDSIVWYGDSLGQSVLHIGDTFLLNQNQPGSYQVWVREISDEGCFSQFTHLPVYISPKLEAHILTHPPSCVSKNDGKATAIPLNGYPPFRYVWSNGDSTQTANNLPPGDVTVVIIDSAMCLRTFQAYVPEADSIKVRFQIERPSCLPEGPEGKITIQPTGGNPPYQITCNGELVDTILSNIEPSTYHFQIIDSNACVKDTTIHVEKLDDCLEIATILTPNGDHLNDTWQIRSIQYFPKARIEVFDKFGNLVFSSDGEYEPWDGTYKGSILPAGSYYYVIKFSPDGEQITGIVDILY
ncbi:MAG: gliding motility-associated C-terminal domain-containing protein [Bacteroidales bacterium]|nr:gliding motility-associated C-terminal domain-containing protein [Bacteroidales bacterium]